MDIHTKFSKLKELKNHSELGQFYDDMVLALDEWNNNNDTKTTINDLRERITNEVAVLETRRQEIENSNIAKLKKEVEIVSIDLRLSWNVAYDNLLEVLLKSADAIALQLKNERKVATDPISDLDQSPDVIGSFLKEISSLKQKVIFLQLSCNRAHLLFYILT